MGGGRVGGKGVSRGSLETWTFEYEGRVRYVHDRRDEDFIMRPVELCGE